MLILKILDQSETEKTIKMIYNLTSQKKKTNHCKNWTEHRVTGWLN